VKAADNSALELKLKGFVMKAKPEKNEHPLQMWARSKYKGIGYSI
jgi:hypothetical protein